MRGFKNTKTILSEEDEFQITRFLNCVGYKKKLSPEMETELGFSNNPKRHRLLVLHNTLFLISVVRKYKVTYGMQVPIEDLLQEGYIGLEEAVREWDPSRGFRLISFAVWKIQMKLSNAIFKYGYTSYVPGSRRKVVTEITKYEKMYEQEYFCKPQFLETLYHLRDKGIKNSKKIVQECWILSKFNLGLDSPHKVRIDSDTFMELSVSPLDLVPDTTYSVDPSFTLESFRAKLSAMTVCFLADFRIKIFFFKLGLWEVVKNINETELEFISQYADGSTPTFDDLASIYGLTSSRINQIFWEVVSLIKKSPTIMGILEDHKYLLRT